MPGTPVGIRAAIGQRDHDVVFADAIAQVQQALRADAHGFAKPRDTGLRPVDGDAPLCPLHGGGQSIKTTC
ncbi:hypothetical protein D3C85_1735900 [compost metagenome]